MKRVFAFSRERKVLQRTEDSFDNVEIYKTSSVVLDENLTPNAVLDEKFACKSHQQLQNATLAFTLDIASDLRQTEEEEEKKAEAGGGKEDGDRKKGEVEETIQNENIDLNKDGVIEKDNEDGDRNRIEEEEEKEEQEKMKREPTGRNKDVDG